MIRGLDLMKLRLNQKRATILLCSVAAAAFATSALARPVHHRHRAAATAHIAANLQNDVADRDMRYSSSTAQIAADTSRHARRHGRQSLAEARAEAQSHANSAYGGFTSNDLVAEARKYIGTNPTGRGSLWCGAFMDLVLKRTGHPGGGNLALGYEHYGTRVAGPQVGAIAVMGRRGGGHVGVVSGIDANGNPIIVSGNHNHTVAESVYPRSRIAAYVMPGG
jgi:uncharacterized protein (TIGR02594 family)